MTTFLCPLCDDFTETKLLFIHIPVCYTRWCSNFNFDPFCTCTTCKGVHQHPNSSPPLSPKLIQCPPFGSPSPSPSPCSAKPIEIPTPTPTPTPVPSIPANSTNSIDLTLNALVGKDCLFCPDIQRSLSQCPVPLISVGSFRKIKLCKKAHFTKLQDLVQFETVITSLLEIVSASDVPLGSSLDYNDDDIPEPSVTEVPCSGYKFIDASSKTACTKTCKPLLSIRRKGTTHYFCCAKHLTRFICKHQTSLGKEVKGGKKGQSEAPTKKNTKRKRKQKKSEEEEEEEEDGADNDDEREDAIEGEEEEEGDNTRKTKKSKAKKSTKRPKLDTSKQKASTPRT